VRAGEEGHLALACTVWNERKPKLETLGGIERQRAQASMNRL